MEKILIIDDDVQLSKLIEEFLVTFNYEIKIMQNLLQHYLFYL